MNQTMFVTSIGIICLIAVAVAGCVGNNPGNKPVSAAPSPSETPVPGGHLVVNESQNNATVFVKTGDVITVKLAENPTTGFQWNLTTTPGLAVTTTSFVPSDPTGKRVGSGGTRTWDIATAAKGKQQVTAAYRRTWEPVTGNETAFILTVVVS